MYKCDDCGAVFEKAGDKVVPERYEIWGANVVHDHHYECCPYCGSEEFVSYQEEEDG